MKMKKIVTLALMLVACIQAWAETWTDSKGTTWSFSVEFDATITGASNTEGVLVIPSKVYVNNTAYDVTGIAPQAFKDQSGITGVLISDGIRTIGEEAFAGCYNMEKLYLPYTLTTIGEGAFRSSNSLATVYSMMQTPPQINEYDIYNRTHAKLYIPKECSSAYNQANYWKDYEEIIEQDSWFDNLGVCWRYALIGSGRAAIHGCDQKEGTLVIPSTVSRNSASLNVFGIFNEAFKNNSGITAVEIPASLDNIGALAFYNCLAINTVTIPSDSKLSTIGNKAFSTCESLTNITIPTGVSSIGEEAFYGCVGLNTINIPSTVTFIGNKAFNGCDNLNTVFSYVETPFDINEEIFSNSRNATLYIPDGKEDDYRDTNGWRLFGTIIDGNVFFDNEGLIWTFSVNGNNATIKGCSKKDGVMVIPEQVVDANTGTTYPVTQIGEKAFYCYTFTEVTIPGSVLTINKNAFKNCSLLTKVNGMEAVTTIGEHAFDGCRALTDITFPSALQTLGEMAFFNCESLKAVINIPATLQNIGKEAFKNCEKLTTVNIAEGITTIPYKMFEGCLKLAAITMPTTMRTIGESAFGYCEELATVNLNEGLTTIEKDAFWGCRALKRIIIPEGITTISENTFRECEALTNIMMPEKSLTTIQQRAFDGCRSLVSLVIPPTVESIGDFAFSECVGLTGIIIPEGVLTIGERTFSSCNSLVNIILPKGLATIGDFAFYQCQNLESVTIYEGVTSIGHWAFYGCPKLNKVYNYIKRPIEIGENTFSNYSTATLYVLPKHITDYSYAAEWKKFSQIVDMSQSWTDANHVTWRFLDYGIYAEITGATQTEGYLAIPETVFVEERELQVTAVTEEAFKDGSGLTKLNIPEGVEKLETAAFYNCENLQTIIIPSTLNYTGMAVFEGCTALTEVYNFMQSPYEIVKNDFSNYETATLYVPKGCAEAYRMENHWGTFSNIIEMNDHVWFDNNCQFWDFNVRTDCMDATITRCNAKESNLVIPEQIPCRGTKMLYQVTDIADNVFNGRTDIISISLPESLHTIGNSTFEGCTALTGINLPENLYVIENAAFKGCENLTSVMMPENLQHVGEEAFSGCKALKNVMIAALKDKTIAAATFYGCENLAKVVIPEGITTIGNEAFSGCVKVSDVIMPKSLTTIGEQAFNGCTAITTVSIPENVTTIGDGAFAGCNSLTTVNCEVENPVSIIEETFSNRANAILYVPATSLSDYVSYPVWQDFLEIRPINDKVFVDPATNIAWDYKVVTFSDQELQLFADLYDIHGLPKTGAVILGTSNYEGEISIPAKVKDGATEYSVITIDNGVFANKSAITKVTVKGASFIGNSVFAGCTALTNVALPEGLVWIEAEAFKGCNALTEIEIPASVVMIDQGAFYNCSQLTQATLLPENLKSIGEYAFWGCINLTEVYSYMQQPVEIDGYVFTNRNNATLYVPSGCSSAYNAALFWKQFKQIVEMDPITTVTLTIGVNGVATFASKYDLNFSSINGIKAYIAAGFDHATGKLTLTQIDEVPAGTGLYIKGEPGTYEIPIEETEMYAINMLKGVTKTTTLAPTTGDKTNFILAKGDHGLGFYTLSNEGTIAAGKAYLQLPTAQVQLMAGPVNLVFEDEQATGIEEMEISNIDSQAADGEWYSLDGKLLEQKPTHKGIYIFNGKKQMVK